MCRVLAVLLNVYLVSSCPGEADAVQADDVHQEDGSQRGVHERVVRCPGDPGRVIQVAQRSLRNSTRCVATEYITLDAPLCVGAAQILIDEIVTTDAVRGWYPYLNGYVNVPRAISFLRTASVVGDARYEPIVRAFEFRLTSKPTNLPSSDLTVSVWPDREMKLTTTYLLKGDLRECVDTEAIYALDMNPLQTLALRLQQLAQLCGKRNLP